MAGGIFVSYRRDDTRHAAGRLADDLAGHFGAERIFRDIDGIDPGLDFRDALEQALASCVAMVVLIGPNWLDIKDEEGRRRLDQPDDWIRQEIARALARNIRVIPVLVEGTRLPTESQLPADLAGLRHRQAVELSDSRWKGDLKHLVDKLGKIPGLGGGGTDTGGPWRKMGWVAAALLAATVLAVYLADEIGGPTGDPTDEPTGWEPPIATAPAPIPPQPQPQPQPQPPSQPGRDAKPVPNMAGTWRTLDGETYEVHQEGRKIRLAAFAMGQPIGGGTGDFDGQVLELKLNLIVHGVPLGESTCHLQAGPEMQRFAGMCQGRNGPFLAQFFR